MFPKFEEESREAVKEVERFRKEPLNNLAYEQTFVFLPIRPLMHIIILKAALAK